MSASVPGGSRASALDHPLLLASATALAESIRDGRTTSREVVEAHVRRVEAVNPRLNAVVEARFEAALAEADAADRRVRGDRGGRLPPLLGVPFTVKEAFALAGHRNTGGLVARREVRAEADATAVRRLREAGAIPLGTTNVPELCMWMETHNRVHGRTSNPYDPRWIAGGSSGGEGAIVGAGASPFGLGSDIGGSIRLPAFFNGVFGHKPTGGLVPGTGQFPMAHAGDGRRYLTTGPLCRRAEDLMPLLELLAGPDGEDEQARPMRLGDPARVDLSRLRVLDVRGNGRVPVDPRLVEAQARAARHLAGLGAVVSSPSFIRLERSFGIWSAMLGAASPRGSFRATLGRPSALAVLFQLALWAVRLSPHTFPALALALIEDLGRLTPRRTARLLADGHQLREDLAAALGDDGVMLYPSYSRPAPRHLVPMALTFDWVYTAIVNVLELPATQVPLGLDPGGRPLGVQVIGGPGQDHLTIRVAAELERAFGGWVPPPR